MAFRFTEQHALSLIRPQLFPGEHLLFRMRGVQKPWYSRILARAGSLLWRNFLVVGTNQRVLLLRHRSLLGGYALMSVEGHAYGDIDFMKLGWGLFTKSLKLRLSGQRLSRKIVLGRFWMAGNFNEAANLVKAWQEQRRALASGASPLSLVGRNAA
ncbi:hypothetical protein LVJ94_33975 [Pendulispora rubella]|uniref:YokE-like PH domain-containing protein n=1 Tax=Pendulispora rubella TaxID=2741070 RepID=A0ABZ2KTB7_9BACT